MSLFEETEIDEYSKRVSRLLSNYILYNRETFHNWFFGFTEDDADNIIDEQQYDDYKTVMAKLIKNANPCSTDSNVYGGYTKRAMRSALSMRTKGDDAKEGASPKKNNYDILFAIDKLIVSTFSGVNCCRRALYLFLSSFLFMIQMYFTFYNFEIATMQM